MSRIVISTLTSIYYRSSDSVTPIKLEPTSAIVVIGYIPNNSTRFAINLTCRTSGNIAFHFNPRLDRGYIVRNSKVKGYWHEEETCSPYISASRLFQHNNYFHLIIFCLSKEFYVSVNGHHFCTFAYRLPLESIINFEYNGEIEDVRFRLKTLCIYPDPKIIQTSKKFQLSQHQLLTEDLNVPITVSITEEFQCGTRIFIKGRLKLLPHSFYVNLQNSPLLFPHPDIALHLNPRFQYGHQTPCVVMNCWTNGSWQHEERHEGQLSWGPGRDFLLTIRCEYEGYIIWLGNKMIGEFKHRIKPSVVDTLQITGDVMLYELGLSYGG
ncbi:galectin-8-like isoform X2 [Chelonus insularis]|uniref:galectin-8-like isoform X2 n=1 Tax=Chelonus insularis TaxID=460826 RepID=UPI00158D0E77|nr:galectin-8-like isoform X2 [Chelonus insularis]